MDFLLVMIEFQRMPQQFSQIDHGLRRNSENCELKNKVLFIINNEKTQPHFAYNNELDDCHGVIMNHYVIIQ